MIYGFLDYYLRCPGIFVQSATESHRQEDTRMQLLVSRMSQLANVLSLPRNTQGQKHVLSFLTFVLFLLLSAKDLCKRQGMLLLLLLLLLLL